jgi:hypothetical protein
MVLRKLLVASILVALAGISSNVAGATPRASTSSTGNSNVRVIPPVKDVIVRAKIETRKYVRPSNAPRPTVSLGRITHSVIYDMYYYNYNVGAAVTDVMGLTSTCCRAAYNYWVNYFANIARVLNRYNGWDWAISNS